MRRRGEEAIDELRQVAAVGARNLHLLATREGLGPLRGQEVAVAA